MGSLITLPEHSPIGASSMHRWAMCPGSIRESRRVPAKASSSYAEEGVQAHELAKHWLNEGREPAFPSDEMRMAVKTYVDRIHHFRTADEDGVEVHVEHRFHLTAVHPDAFGTADAVIWRPQYKILHVDDFKYGEGILVQPKDNVQLLYYALGAVLDFNYPVDVIELTVVQPRIDHPEGPIRSWRVDRIDLLDFRTDLKRYIAATEDPDAPLVPGEHCRFCPAAGVCPALANKAQALAKLEFGLDAADLPKPYDPEKLRWALDSLPALKAFIKAVDEFAYHEAEQGRCPPGYKLVKKRPVRKWKDPEQVEQMFKKLGATPSSYMKPAQLLSPNQALDDQGVSPKPFEDLFEYVSSGHTLVPDSDPRPSVKVGAKEEFEILDVTPINPFDDEELHGHTKQAGGHRLRDLFE